MALCPSVAVLINILRQVLFSHWQVIIRFETLAIINANNTSDAALEVGLHAWMLELWQNEANMYMQTMVS